MTHMVDMGVNAARVNIRRVVSEQPGIHFRELARVAHVSSAGQLRHHLDRMERAGVLVELEDGRYKRFFVAGQHDPKVRPEIARFSRTVPRRIARLLLTHSMNRTELRRSLGCADSTLGYHLSRMVMLGDLAKTRGPNCCQYSLTREDLVRAMLQEVRQDSASPSSATVAEPVIARPLAAAATAPFAEPTAAPALAEPATASSAEPAMAQTLAEPGLASPLAEPAMPSAIVSPMSTPTSKPWHGSIPPPPPEASAAPRPLPPPFPPPTPEPQPDPDPDGEPEPDPLDSGPKAASTVPTVPVDAIPMERPAAEAHDVAATTAQTPPGTTGQPLGS